MPQTLESLTFISCETRACLHPIRESSERWYWSVQTRLSYGRAALFRLAVPPDTARLLLQPGSANVCGSQQVNSETKVHKQHESLAWRESSFYAHFKITLPSLFLKRTNEKNHNRNCLVLGKAKKAVASFCSEFGC